MELHQKIAQTHPDLARGEVQCDKCGRLERVNSAGCMERGWPECCGETMRLLTVEPNPRPGE